MKKVVALFTAVLVMAVLFPVTALAAPGATGADGDFTWREVDGGKVEVTGYLGSDTVITVPDTLNSMPVVGVANNAFSSKPFTSVTIPDGVIYLGEGAFAGCASLANITLPDSIETMGDGCFYQCTALVSITLPDSLKSLGLSAFSGDTGLNTVVMRNNVTTMGGSIFEGCTNLTNVTLSTSLISISNNAFHNCTSLQQITIPGSVQSIEAAAFIGTGLTSINIPGSVKSIGTAAFNGLSSLTSITLHSGLEAIGDTAFTDCDNLGEVTIPETVTSLGNNVFATCDNLNKVMILAETFSYTGAPFGGDPLSDGIYGFAGSTAQSIATIISKTFHTLGKVIYDSQGGPAIPWGYALTGDTVDALPSQPERQGYIFGGWWTAANGGGTQFTATTPVTANITVYAKWTPVLALAVSPPDGKILTGDKVAITPNVEGGTWSFDTTYLSRDGSNFTGLKEGSVRVTYTAGEQSKYLDVVITKKLALSASVSDGKIYSGGRITITPGIEGGTWSFDASYLSRDGNTFTGLKAGTSRVTYTAEGQTISFDITIAQSELPKTGQDGTWIWILAGAVLAAFAGAVAMKKVFNK